MTNPSIDTIRLCIFEFTLEKGHSLKTVPTSRNRSKVSFKLPLADSSLSPERVIAAYHRGSNINVHIRHLGRRDFFGRGCVMCIVTFSAPKVFHGCNFLPLKREELIEALHMVQQHLTSIGICADVFSAIVSRLDVFRNCFMHEPTSSYMPLLSALRLPRTKENEYPTGITLVNQQQRIAIYDKNAEMESRRVQSPVPSQHCLRFEHSGLRAPKVQKFYGVHTIKDLINQFDTLGPKIDELAVKRLFNEDVPLPKAPSPWATPQEPGVLSSMAQQLYAMVDLYGHRGIDRLVMAHGWAVLERECGSQELQETLKYVTGGQVSIFSRLEAKRRDSQWNKALAQRSASGTPLPVLYHELKAKLSGRSDSSKRNPN